MQNKLLTMPEVAKYLDMSEKQVKDLVAKGRLTVYKIGGTFLRFKPEQVEAVKKFITPETYYTSTPPERFVDFLYFNDFYILATLFIIGLITIILVF